MPREAADAPQSDVKDSWVPKFDNTTSGYKEWRKRIQLYARKMAIQKRDSEIGISVLSALTGSSWRQCEDLDLKELQKKDGLDHILKRLDAQWKYDERIEMQKPLKSTSTRPTELVAKLFWSTALRPIKRCATSTSTRSTYLMR